MTVFSAHSSPFLKLILLSVFEKCLSSFQRIGNNVVASLFHRRTKLHYPWQIIKLTLFPLPFSITCASLVSIVFFCSFVFLHPTCQNIWLPFAIVFTAIQFCWNDIENFWMNWESIDSKKKLKWMREGENERVRELKRERVWERGKKLERV